MKEEFWQKNNPNIKKLLDEYVSTLSVPCKTEEEVNSKTEKLNSLRIRLNQENMNSQLMWIALRSCKRIPCKKCYLNQICKTYEVKDSQILAAQVIKGKLGVKDEEVTKKGC